MTKLYIVSNSDDGTEDIDGIYYLISENGEYLYSHLCSNNQWAINDLIKGRPERIEECNKKYGKKKWKSVYLGSDDMTIEEILKRNKEWYETHKELIEECKKEQ